MLSALADSEFQPGLVTALAKLCEAGARHGWRDLETASNPNLLAGVSARAKASLRRDLRRSLQRLTRPCLELQRTSFGLALNSIGVLPGPIDPQLAERMFLGDKPGDRLFPLFNNFPVLATLWCRVISQWREHVTEVLSRFRKDRAALAHAFFGNEPIGAITDVLCSLSDSHNQGRTVMQLQFKGGAVIYKPRPGEGEWEWGSLMEWMNLQSFRPQLRAARVLRRNSYCWMERIEVAPCQDRAAGRRFYQRIGGMIAAAYLVRAVDCHRDNLIAAGEDPVLVDADALWHVSGVTRTQSPLDLLYRTGFFPNSNPRSLQSRSSILGRTRTGKHLARIGTRPLGARQYEREIAQGFSKAWHCILGTERRRTAFARRLRRIRSRERRWIYLATERYTAIRQASIQPSALQSRTERDRLIARLCKRKAVAPAVIAAETHALKRLDIPYFIRSTKELMPPDKGVLPPDLLQSIRRALTL